MAHNLPLLPSGIPVDGDEEVWIDKFVDGEWNTYRITAAEIAALATAGGAQLADENEFTASQRVQPVVANVTGAYAADAALSNNFELTLTGNLTLNPTNLHAGMVLNFELIQDGSGGHTITLNAIFKFGGGTIPTWVTTAGAVNLISGYVDSAGRIICGGVAGAA